MWVFVFLLPSLPLAAKERRQTGDQLRTQKREGEARSDKIEARKNCVKRRGVKRCGEGRRDETKLYCQNPLSSRSVLQEGLASVRRTTFRLHGVPLSFLISPFFPPLLPSSSPSFTLSHPQSGATAIFFHIRPTL